MYRFHRAAGMALLGILGGMMVGSSAQEPTAPTTPKNVSIPQSFRMFLVYDKRFDPKDDRNREGKLHDPVDEHGLFTVVAVISRRIPKGMEDPLFAVMAQQESLALKYKTRRMGAFAAFLALSRNYADDEAREPLTQQIKDLGEAAKYKQLALGLGEATKVPEGADPEAKDGLEPTNQVVAWGIKPDDDITIIVYHRFNIVKRMAFTKDKPPAEADLKEIGDTVDGLMTRR